MDEYGLNDWADIKDAQNWKALLIGNGASRAISDKFAYSSLFSAAALTDDDKALFRELKTKNFEDVLRALRTAKIVCEQLDHDHNQVTPRLEQIRVALVTAVKDNHVAWNDFAGSRAKLMYDALRAYKTIFTTSYDLAVYWAINDAGPGNFFDGFFPANTFNIDEEPSAAKNAVYWLHGALHMHRTDDGFTKKRTNMGASLLNQFASGGKYPLYVAEGTPKEKLTSIRNSDYLRHCLDTLEGENRPLVVFGQDLGGSDEHLAHAVNMFENRPVAYGIYPESQARVDALRSRISETLSGPVTFFNSTTHPLGHADLHD